MRIPRDGTREFIVDVYESFGYEGSVIAHTPNSKGTESEGSESPAVVVVKLQQCPPGRQGVAVMAIGSGDS